MRQTIRRYMSGILTALLCMCMLPTAAVDAAENQSGKSIDIPVVITAEGVLPSEPETYTISLTKQVESAPMPEGADGDTASLQIHGPGTGTFTFNYSKPGVFLYQITQEKGTKTNCTYDDAAYDLYVYVTNSADGGLDINAYMEKDSEEEKPEEAAFHNVYTGTAKYDPPIEKVVDEKSGTAPEDSVFTFRMTPQDPSDPMPDNKEASHDPTTGALTMNIKGPGSYEFGWMYFDETHCGKTFVYTVEEIDNGESGYSYDRNIYKLTIKVVQSEDGIALQTFITDESGEVSGMKFTNIYEEEDEPEEKDPEKDDPEKDDPEEEDPKKDDPVKEDDTPDKHHSHKKDTEKHHSHDKDRSSAKTGDETNVTLWVSVVGASLALMLVLLFLKRKSSRKDDM